MSTLAFDDLGPISPELVLVSPPDLAALARRALPEHRQVAVAPLTQPLRLGRLGLAGLYAACLATTLTPLAFVVAVR